jgi:hypothetical protein
MLSMFLLYIILKNNADFIKNHSVNVPTIEFTRSADKIYLLNEYFNAIISSNYPDIN